MKLNELVTGIPVALLFLMFPFAASTSENDAKAIFHKGVTLFENGEYAKAAVEFRRAYDTDPSWKIQYNIGQCEAAAKHHGRAMEAFELYLSMGGDEVPVARRTEVTSELDRLHHLVGFIALTAPERALVLVNGEVRAVAPLIGNIMVAAGVDHELLVTLNDVPLLKRKLRVSGTQTVIVTVSAPELQIAEDVPSSPSLELDGDVLQGRSNPMPGRRLLTSGVVLTSIGAASLLAGAVTGMIAVQKSKALEGKCPDGVCEPQYHDENNTMQNMVTGTNVLFIAGGTLAIAGVLLIIAGKRRHERMDKGTMLPAFSKNTAGIIWMKGF
ncbi:MAG: hypothetical protein JXR76_11080 [Deltaproteobacteria bacterium]|nr:hypothetical protein [Deltaproteobacteria bacterium]